MNLWIALPILAALIGMRLFRPNILIWLAAWWIGCLLILKAAIVPPLPSSIVGLFMAILSAAFLLYGTTDAEKVASVSRILSAFLTQRKYAPFLAAACILIPIATGFSAFRNATRTVEAPASGRTIHPAPPSEISFRGKKMNILTASNPFRPLEERDKHAFAAHVAEGRAIYYRNCVFCHGDDMQGDGIFSHGFNPQPADFDDPTTIAMLQESYLFWRIAKGAPGLPDESTPWASGMPAWESTLTEDQIWDVILFLYSFTERKPRAQERGE